MIAAFGFIALLAACAWLMLYLVRDAFAQSATHERTGQTDAEAVPGALQERPASADASTRTRQRSQRASTRGPARRAPLPGDDLIGLVEEPPRWTALDDHQLARFMRDASPR
jgi:hypothetical protein